MIRDSMNSWFKFHGFQVDVVALINWRVDINENNFCSYFKNIGLRFHLRLM